MAEGQEPTITTEQAGGWEEEATPVQNAQPGPPPKGIDALATALATPLQGALLASMEGFWARLDARQASSTTRSSDRTPPLGGDVTAPMGRPPTHPGGLSEESTAGSIPPGD